MNASTQKLYNFCSKLTLENVEETGECLRLETGPCANPAGESSDVEGACPHQW